jgi:hypothetical protein
MTEPLGVVSHGRHPGIVALLNTSLSTEPPAASSRLWQLVQVCG